MSVKDVQFQYLNIKIQTRYKNKGFKMKQNYGLDTETYNGYVKLICDSDGNSKDIEDFYSIISFLTHGRYNQSFNWFYNLQYDFESIIKYLDLPDLVTLYNTGSLDLENYDISYIPKKFFSIHEKKNNRYYHFYDLYNFIEGSLQNAAKNFLGKSKFSDIVDSAKLNTDLDYWNENYDNIVKYCIQDSVLTKEIADYFWSLLEKNMNFVPKRPFSKGKISEEYFSQKCYIPTINDIPKAVLEIAYNSYSGGRFELLKRGFMENVYNYDIHSAYPDSEANLIDYNKGKWLKVTNNKVSKNAYTGYYYCSVNCLEPYFSPFLYKVGSGAGLNVYPNGKFNVYISKWEYDFIVREFPDIQIKIKKGYEFFEKDLIYPFKEEINRLYEWKQKETDKNIKYAVKIMLNSLYGKFIQVSPSGNITGKLFNPIYASEITAKTRIKLLELGLQSPQNIISFSTDGIASLVPLKVPKGDKMGEFGADFEGEGVVIMSDIYNYWAKQNKNKTKNRLRGFCFTADKEIVKDKTIDNEVLLRDILEGMENKTIYEYFTHRPHHLGECLIHHKKLSKEDINVFAQVRKSIDINGDKKRHWERDFINGKECLETRINSIPLVI
jgi:hypothetical protein